MKIWLPKEMGFCNGVSSAINKALSINGGAYCLGQIVHNKEVTAQLSRRGIIFVEDIDDVPQGSTLLIRAHGVGKCVYDKANERNITIVDATCPSVKAIQRKAQDYHNKGYQIVLVGDDRHPEIVGINGWCDNSAIVFDGNGVLTLNDCDKVLVMFQTTFDSRFFEKSLQNICTYHVKTLEVFNTICYNTLQRQNYAQMLSSKCDLAVVVGDYSSSNTKRLYEIASQNCRTVLTDGSECDFDLENCKNVCILAGASTPNELCKGVFKVMMENAKDTVSVEVETVASDVAAAEQKTMNKDEAMLAKAVSDMKEGHKYKLGQKVKCRVVLVSDDGVYVSIPSSKKEGFIPNAELSMDGDYQAAKKTLDTDAVLECAVISVEKGITLSKKVIDERYKDDALVAGIKEGNEFACLMTKVGKECLTGKLGSYTVIVHASQIKIGYVKNLEAYVGKTLRS